MQDLKEAINNILDEELVKAKEIIHANLYAKMGALLEQTLLEYAPNVLEDESMEEELDEEKRCEDGNCDDDEDTGYSKKKMKSDKKDEEDKKDKEDDKEEDDKEDDKEEKEMNEAFETFTDYLSQLIEEIEAETGEELTEDEILTLADMVINENFEDEDVEELEEE
jgi:hypothetical protein